MSEEHINFAIDRITEDGEGDLPDTIVLHPDVARELGYDIPQGCRGPIMLKLQADGSYDWSVVEMEDE